MPWVIDRKAVNEEACSGCGCSDCQASDACFETCAKPIAKALVTAYFNANVNGLGTNGWGWEELAWVGSEMTKIAVKIKP